MAPALLVETHGRVRVLTLNRPERSNAISPDLRTALIDSMLDAEDDAAVSVIVLTGAGSRAFCAGADIKARAETDAAGLAANVSRAQRNMHEVVIETRKPTIAALNGSAVGGGFELALACDIRIAGAHVTFGLPEAKRGMGAHFATVLLPRMIPPGFALEMLYTGDSIDMDTATRWGLVNRVVPAGTELAIALELAQRIAGNAPITLRRIKETMVKASGLPLAAAMRLNEGVSPYESEDRKRGFGRSWKSARRAGRASERARRTVPAARRGGARRVAGSHQAGQHGVSAILPMRLWRGFLSGRAQ